jgi:uncharacterized protein (TIGR02246 family)
LLAASEWQTVSSEAERLVRELNATWQEGDLDKLAGFFHESVVLLPPDSGEPIVGRDAVLETYRNFLQSAVLHDFTETTLTSFDFPGTVIVHMGFAVDFSVGEQRMRDSGLEVYAVDTSETELQVIWRSQTILRTESI